ncbi:MAG: hypothetical protein COV47_04910, partial [Candidatus Diapherotrites archaeon CG11_big_fil_rev_8_21_14_0_20_37_9]
MVTQKYGFGELETRALFVLEQNDTALVRTSDLGRLLKISKNHANKLVWQLVKKKRLIRIRKGVYLFAPLKAGPKGEWTEEGLLVISELLKNKPYYVSFWTALNFYHLTEQVPLVVQTMITHRRRSFSAVGTKFEFITVKKLGEWREEKIGQKKIRIATIEQLLIDCLTHPEHGGGVEEACKGLWEARKRIDYKKLGDLAQKSPDVVQRRLGYLLEKLGLKKIKLSKKSSGWRWL